jgi:hypothetical protein
MLVELQLLVDDIQDDKPRSEMLEHLNRLADFLLGYRNEVIDAACPDLWNPLKTLIADTREEERSAGTSN